MTSEVILAVDLGNTNTHLAVFEEENLVRQWRFSTDLRRTSHELEVLMCDLPSFDELKGRIKTVVLSSVVPPVTPVFIDTSRDYLGIDPVVVSADLDLGIRIDYYDPREIGADRLANAIGAYELYGGPIVVVDLGTATTFDVIAADGAHLGGAISSGVESSAQALFRGAAKLPRISPGPPLRIIGRSTEECIRSGVFLGAVGGMDEIVRRIAGELKTPVKVVATGGWATVIAPYSDTVQMVNPTLTLEGLRKILIRIRRKKEQK